jgi:sec-independent protein translocase protein TatA
MPVLVQFERVARASRPNHAQDACATIKLNQYATTPSVPDALSAIQSNRARRASKPQRLLMMFLFILDSLGSSELLVILGAALIFFGPRRLPQLSRQLGKSLSEFRRASEDFKRTWEREVNLENLEKGIEPGSENSILDKATERLRAAREAAARESSAISTPETGPAVTPADPALVQEQLSAQSAEKSAQPVAKHDWL